MAGRAGGHVMAVVDDRVLRDVPGRPGEELVRPVTRPGPGKGRPRQHPAHRPPPRLRKEPAGQPAERAERRHGKQRREPGEQAHQRAGDRKRGVREHRREPVSSAVSQAPAHRPVSPRPYGVSRGSRACGAPARRAGDMTTAAAAERFLVIWGWPHGLITGEVPASASGLDTPISLQHDETNTGTWRMP